MDFESVRAVIEAARAAQAERRPLDMEELDELAVGAVLWWCLVVLEEGPDAPPTVTAAAEQYLLLRGDVDDDALTFLPAVFDDLHARLAVLDGGMVLVDEFRAAILSGGTVEHARELVPPAFAAVVDERMALDLFAACVALMARLSAGVPAGCVAEELVAVELLRNASVLLETRAEEGTLTPAEATAASEELYMLFELFEDDDVLRMFDMKEPGDAAVAGHSASDQERGVVDQRPEAWFIPFGATPLTGHLAEGPGES
ncbi:MAG: hypothetical protein ACJ762_15945 [Solirubrobacteraceae bacterium]